MSDSESVESVANRDYERYSNPLVTNILNHWKDDWFALLTTTGNISPNNLQNHTNYYRETPKPEIKLKKFSQTMPNNRDLRKLPLTQLLPHIENVENINKINWGPITNNPNITFNYMISHKNFPWKWYIAPNKKDFDVNAIITHDDVPWNWASLSSSEKVPLHFIIENKNKPWDWVEICASKMITVEIIDDNQDIQWVWSELQHNCGTAEYIIMKYPDKPWNWLQIYGDYHHPIPEFYIMLNNMFETKMLLSPNQTHHVVDEESEPEDDEEYIWSDIISCSLFLTPELLLKYKHLQFNWNRVTANEQIPFDFIKQHMELPWSPTYIVNRSDFKIDIVIENPEKEWNWYAITKEATFQQIKSMPNLPWNWNVIQKRAYHREQNEHVQIQLVKFMLLVVLNHYEEEQTQTHEQLPNYELADYVFANSYLVKFMIGY